MPLYMDFHIISDVTVDEVKRAHIADQAIQDRYKVKYHQFWVNEEAGTVFCLMEGPDKESCSRVHREAHGNVACQIVEVERGFYKLMMGESLTDNYGLVLHKDRSIDTGYRFVMAVDIRGNTKATHSADYRMLVLPLEPKNLISRIIPTYQGREIRRFGDDMMIAVFTEASDAMGCAVEIQTQLLKISTFSEDDTWDVSLKIGIAGGQPVTEGDDLFEKTIRLAQRLSLIAGTYNIVASPLIQELSGMDRIAGNSSSLKALLTSEEKFLEDLFNITEEKLSDSTFTVERLCRDIGISQPQLYRKTTSVTGRSPNAFIRDIKMKKALSLLKTKEFNISEIALMVGYNNPSYFSKCFQEAYGINPSRVVTG